MSSSSTSESSSESSSPAPPPPEPEPNIQDDLEDPLCITESDIQNFKESDDEFEIPVVKRKLVHSNKKHDGFIKRQKTEDLVPNGTVEPIPDDCNIKLEDDKQLQQQQQHIIQSPKESPKKDSITELIENALIEASGSGTQNIDDIDKQNFDITEKLKEMAEISVKPVSKVDKDMMDKKNENSADSVEITKKDKKDLQDRKVTNFRKNIKDVLDETQLDATTLAAQRQESERLARVQEQQRIIREVQRQIAAEKQANKTQAKVLSLLQGETTIKSIIPNSSVCLTDPLLEKFALTPSVTIGPVTSKSTIHSLISTDEKMEDTTDDDDEETKDQDLSIIEDSKEKSKAVVVDSSSDDDCIILSDDEEEEEIEEDPNNSGEHVNDSYNQPDSEGRVIVNIGHSEREPNIYVAPQIARIIKPHQIGGVRFLFDNIIESTERFDTSSGFGCILAHSMGLGKTLQLVCFCDIFLRHTSSKTILVIMPINTLQNWLHEFNMWLPLPEDAEKSPLNAQGEVRPRQFKIQVLNDSHKSLNARAKVVLEWMTNGGVLMMGYEMYRLLSQKKMATKKKKKKNATTFNETKISMADQTMFDKIHEALVRPGPDLVVCDEGHRIKNAHASTSVALKQIKSKRRVVLTGYPLQNNLLEYWCMVDFVRPSYLGTRTEFSNMFERPINNGQCIDSTPQDIRLMRYRAHVLHSLLKGFVQRRSHAVLQSCLPDKTEYVMLVRMTEFQRKLYSVFMDEVVRTKKVPNPLKAFSVCCKIWNHPDVLYNFLKKRELDLEIELEEAEMLINKTESASLASAKKRGRKKGEQTKDKVSSTGIVTPHLPTLLKSESVNKMNEKSNHSAHNNSNSSNFPPESSTVTESTTPANGTNSNGYNNPQSIGNNSSGYDTASTYSEYSNYSYNGNPYQAYNYNNAAGNGNQQQYQQNYYSNNTNSSSTNNTNTNNNSSSNNSNNNNNSLIGSSNSTAPGNYWQNNYYPQATSDYSQNYQMYSQPPNPYLQSPYYGNQQQSYQNFEHKPPPPQSTSTNVDSMSQQQLLKTKVEAKDTKVDVKKMDMKDSVSGGLLDDVIKDEKKEELADKLDDMKDLVVAKSSRDDGIPYDWAIELMKDYVWDMLESSPKIEIFFCILNESILLGDRILVFSQSLLTLNLMERFLTRSKIPNSELCWKKNESYFRLDGSTAALEREKLINEFNHNTTVKLFLVSTRAGSLGINLVGANRVIVFDASWNPCHDTQAVCRVYRYGQQKKCYVYRFVMDNCLEKKIYDRQINKQGMADRVVDECNPDAHLSLREVTSLCWDDGEEPEIQDFSGSVDKYTDLVARKVLVLHSKALTKEPFKHESLLVDRKEKKLSLAEKRLAKRGYELEKQAAAKPTFSYTTMGTTYRAFRTPDGAIVHRPVASVRPMQAELGDCINSVRANNPRPNRWVPVEVWQSKGLTAQEMTLPQDVSIQTNSADKSKIFLKAGQKVIVLKSPKGICLQLESGKVIAIRASLKPGQAAAGVGGVAGIAGVTSGLKDDKPQSYMSMQESAQTNNLPPNMRSKLTSGSDGDVIDISNDDDDDVNEIPKISSKISHSSSSDSSTSDNNSAMSKNLPHRNGMTTAYNDSMDNEPVYKEKVVYKPNLVARKPKPPTLPAATVVNDRHRNYEQQQQQHHHQQQYDKSSLSNHKPTSGVSSLHSNAWHQNKSSTEMSGHSTVPTSSYYQQRDSIGGNPLVSYKSPASIVTPETPVRKMPEIIHHQPSAVSSSIQSSLISTGDSAFHPPAGNSTPGFVSPPVIPTITPSTNSLPPYLPSPSYPPTSQLNYPGTSSYGSSQNPTYLPTPSPLAPQVAATQHYNYPYQAYNSTPYSNQPAANNYPLYPLADPTSAAIQPTNQYQHPIDSHQQYPAYQAPGYTQPSMNYQQNPYPSSLLNEPPATVTPVQPPPLPNYGNWNYNNN